MGPLQRTELVASISVALFCFCPQNHHLLGRKGNNFSITWHNNWAILGCDMSTCHINAMLKIHTKNKHLIFHLYDIHDYYRLFTDIYLHWRIRSRSYISVPLQLHLLRQLYGISTTDSNRAYIQCSKAVVPWTAPGINVQSFAKYRRADATRTVPAPQLQHHGQCQSSRTLQQRTSTMDSSRD